MSRVVPDHTTRDAANHRAQRRARAAMPMCCDIAADNASDHCADRSARNRVVGLVLLTSLLINRRASRLTCIREARRGHHQAERARR